jgi:hypothetical protein
MTNKLDLFSATPPQAPKHAKRPHVPLIGKILVTGIVLSGVITAPQIDQVTSRANASGLSEKVSLYLSAPMVQGTNVDGADKESFNALTTGACPTSVNGVSSISFTNSGVAATTSAQIEQVCKVEPWIRSVGSGEGTIYGGASTESSARTFGGDGSKYMGIPFYNSGGERSITFNLASAAKYVGFWWSGGNAGNIVRFFDNSNNLVAEIESADISTKLGAPTNLTVVAADNTTTYVKNEYYGNPVYYSNLSTKPGSAPGVFAGYSNDFIFSYVNLYVEGSLNVTKVQFAGPGFEFDNLAFSTVQESFQNSMVKVLEKTSPGLAWAPTTTLLLSATPATPSSLATKSGDGVISYSVKSQGATGCSVNSSTGVITYTAVGSCVLTATVTGTSTFLRSTKDVTFTISETAPPPSNNSSSGASSSSEPSTPPTKPVPVDPCSISSSDLIETKNRTFSGFAINSARLTPTMKKQIRTWLNEHPERVCVSVAGFTMGPRVLPTDPKLARERARSVRAFIKSIRPEASFTPITSRTQKLVGDDVRRAKVTLRF